MEHTYNAGTWEGDTGEFKELELKASLKFKAQASLDYILHKTLPLNNTKR